MNDRLRPFKSSSCLNMSRHRSHSYREKTNGDLHREKIERIKRHFEQELAKNEHELQLEKYHRTDSSLLPTEYIENCRNKVKNDFHNQLLQGKIEKYMNQLYDEEHRLSQRKLRKIQIENEKYRLESINKIVREQDAICEEKLAAQKSLYNRLLDEQARRLRAEQNLQSFDNLNIEQLKERLTRVEHSNNELKKVIYNLTNQKPIYRSTVYIPKFVD